MCVCVCVYGTVCSYLYNVAMALKEVVKEATFNIYKLKLERKVEIGMYLCTCV